MILKIANFLILLKGFNVCLHSVMKKTFHDSPGVKQKDKANFSLPSFGSSKTVFRLHILDKALKIKYKTIRNIRTLLKNRKIL